MLAPNSVRVVGGVLTSVVILGDLTGNRCCCWSRASDWLNQGSHGRAHEIPYVAKISRPKNFANRFQKGGAEIFATKIIAKAALIHCVIL